LHEILLFSAICNHTLIQYQNDINLPSLSSIVEEKSVGRKLSAVAVERSIPVQLKRKPLPAWQLRREQHPSTH